MDRQQQLERLCYLVVKCNHNYNKQNAAYLRIWRRRKNKNIEQRDRDALNLRDWSHYNFYNTTARKIAKELRPEINQLVKSLGLRMQRMCNCPIIQNIYGDNTVHLNGRRIRSLAFNHTVHSTLELG
jgi:hypothetical protein